jgi:hypothetical protein
MPPDNSINSYDAVEASFKKYYQRHHDQMTSDSILASAKKIAQQTPRILGKSKKPIFEAMRTLSQKPYSQMLVSYLAKRPDFVVIAHPNNTVIPSIMGNQNSGQANFNFDLITVADTGNYGIFAAVPWSNPQSFMINKNNQIEIKNYLKALTYAALNTGEFKLS